MAGRPRLSSPIGLWIPDRPRGATPTRHGPTDQNEEIGKLQDQEENMRRRRPNAREIENNNLKNEETSPIVTVSPAEPRSVLCTDSDTLQRFHQPSSGFRG